MMSSNAYLKIKNSVLKNLNTLSLDKLDYKYSKNSDSSLFTTCFAVFVLDLFKELDEEKSDVKLQLSNYINSFQCHKSGLFNPNNKLHHDHIRNTYQLTCFALSALNILGQKPNYKIQVINNWIGKEYVESYLFKNGCHVGAPGSGNKAMFQAIFLTNEYKNTGEKKYLDSMKYWFDFHERHKNQHGFFGNSKKNYWYKGLQNSFHQLLVYNYWGREYSKLNKVSEIIPLLQDSDGHFAPKVGGGSCEDYDAIYYLLTCLNTGVRVHKSDQIIDRAITAILKNQNKDGGFCESRLSDHSVIKKIFLQLSHVMNSPNKEIFFLKLKKTAKYIFKTNDIKHTGWVAEGQRWNESTLWATWFRCLTLAEITSYREPELASKYFNFHDFIGLGIPAKKNQISLN